MPLSLDELATAAGTTTAEVRRLAVAGLLGDSGDFEAPDVARVRLIRALEAVGVSCEWLATAARPGSVVFDFVDLLMPDAIPLTTETQARLAQRAQLSAGLQQAVQAVLGTLCASEDEMVRADDARVMEIVQRAREMGASDEQIARIVRVTADTARRLVDAQRDFVDEVVLAPALRETGSELGAVRRSAQLRREYRHLGIELFEVLYRRSVEVAVFQNVVEMIQLGLAREGLSTPAPAVSPAIAFVDVSGFTRMTEEEGDMVAAELASRFADLVQQVASVHGGTIVKLLGDGAMVQFPDVTRAVHTMLELHRRAAGAELPTMHAGIDSGPLVRRDGDVFGTVVNLAARASSHAGPGEVLVTGAVARGWKGSGVSFHEVGEVQLRGLTHPVRLFRADPAG
ncbi:MAG: adenylate/guanylate cyclase domain-containing protein [Gammaproteobacteria bacterium]|jgi:adenylate cyclase